MSFFKGVQTLISQITLQKKVLPSLLRYTKKKWKKILKMNESIDNDLSPPTHVKGMKSLNRELFHKTVSIPFVEIPSAKVSKMKKPLKNFILKIPNLSPIMDSENGRAILLNPEMLQNQKFQNCLSELNLCLKQKEITLNYDNWNQVAILRAILPHGVDCNMTSFSMIGHIIHLNLKETAKDYKTVIAQVLLDKLLVAKTIVNKKKTIDGTYRNFEIELLAGEQNFMVNLKENGIKYAFDFSKVFWNPRLVNEHQKLVELFKEGDVVFDVFAGVGPFAIPAAKKSCKVYANDLNPDSYRWLSHNGALNKVSDFLTAYNLDGREFISTIFKHNLIKLYNQTMHPKVHIVMNLPAMALEFLDEFDSLLKGYNFSKAVAMPTVYCYFFAPKDVPKELHIEKCLSAELQRGVKEISCVRNVAPNKSMYRLKLELPQNFLFGDIGSQHKRKKIMQ